MFLLPNDKPQGRGASPRPAGGAGSAIFILRGFLYLSSLFPQFGERFLRRILTMYQ